MVGDRHRLDYPLAPALLETWAGIGIKRDSGAVDAWVAKRLSGLGVPRLRGSSHHRWIANRALPGWAEVRTAVRDRETGTSKAGQILKILG